LKTEEFCRFVGTGEVYGGYEKNEINEKTQGRISSLDRWAVALSQRPLTRAPADVPLLRWRQFVGDARRFLKDGTLDQAARLGWTGLDLFGCDESRPFARVDQMGLIWFIRSGRVVSISSSAAVIETTAGARQIFRRKSEGFGQIAVWELFDAAGRESTDAIDAITASKEKSGA